MRRHVRVENLSAGVIDHEEHVQHSERDRSDTEEVARPDLRSVLPQEWPPSGGRPATMGSLHILGDRSGRNFEPKPRELRLDPALTPKSVFHGHPADEGRGSEVPAQLGGGLASLCGVNAGANTCANPVGATAAPFRALR